MTQQLAPYPLIRPGFKGLNKAKAADTTLGGAWALELQNAVFDDAGRVAARRGWNSQTPFHTKQVGFVDGQTALLLHYDGSNGQTSTTDSSHYAHTMENFIGGALLSTTHPKWGTASFFSASGVPKPVRTSAQVPEFDISGTADFTAEAWVYPDASGAGSPLGVFAIEGSFHANQAALVLRLNAAAGSNWRIGAEGWKDSGTQVFLLAGSTDIPAGAWSHIAVVRSGTNYTVYLNGAREATTSSALTLTPPANTPYVWAGAHFGFSYMVGWIDDLRFTNGLARYTGATYTVPSAAFGDPTAAYAVPRQMHELVRTNGTVDLITAGSNPTVGSHYLFNGVTVPTDITGTLTPTADNWQFINFRGYVLGFQTGHTPIIWTGSGTFVNLVATSGVAPNGNCATAAFGRVWAVSADQQTIKYCALLDPYTWGSTDSGTIDMRTVWTKGMDVVIGIAALGAALVVFGQRHIVIWVDGKGSTIGLDPTTMYVSDTIEGTGLQARDTIQAIGTGDVIYLSPTGLQSLQRAIINKNNPLATADQQVSQYLRGLWQGEDPSAIRSVYDATECFYLLILPRSGTAFCFDTREPLEDGTLRASEWPNFGAYCGAHLRSGNMMFGFAQDMGKYAGYLDNGATYNFVYKSPWMTLADMNPAFEFRRKIPKRLSGILFNDASQTFTYTWSFDFDSTVSDSVSLTATGGRFSEYGLAEYGTNGVYNVNDVTAVAGVDPAEYGGRFTLVVDNEETSGMGRWVQIGINATINDSFLAIQQLDLYAKVGAVS